MCNWTSLSAGWRRETDEGVIQTVEDAMAASRKKQSCCLPFEPPNGDIDIANSGPRNIPAADRIADVIICVMPFRCRWDSRLIGSSYFQMARSIPLKRQTLQLQYRLHCYPSSLTTLPRKYDYASRQAIPARRPRRAKVSSSVCPQRRKEEERVHRKVHGTVLLRQCNV